MLDSPVTEPPDRPGCYIFRGHAGKPLYVGKARSLRSRVASYFHDSSTRKVQQLRREASDLEYVVTASEWEAFLLEDSLIKQFRPPFNVLLKDDKSYPYLKLTVKDRYPKAVFTRRASKDGALYFGPFVPAWKARKNLQILQEHFRVATCTDPLDGSRLRACMYFEMGQCYAPCIAGRVDSALYRQAVEEARLFLEGKTARLRKELAKRMESASARQDYELAAHYRDLWHAAESLRIQGGLTHAGGGHWDLFVLYGGPDAWLLSSFTAHDGKVVDRASWQIREPACEPGELFATLLTRLYSGNRALPDGVAVTAPFDGMDLVARFLAQKKGRKLPIVVPSRGAKHAMLLMLLENARLEFSSRADPAQVFEPLVKALHLPAPPATMECFDISHSGGEATTASCVVWDMGRVDRSRSRTMHIRTAGGGDDFASLAEAVERRYSRLMREGHQLPDLVVIDGGAGQVNAAHAALSRVLPNPPTIVGLAKREEWLYLPGQRDPLILPKDSPALHALMALRDEAHRLAVTHHRARRSQTRLTSSLQTIRGVGAITAKRLLKAFLTTEAVREADEEQLSRVVGRAAARKIRAWADGA